MLVFLNLCGVISVSCVEFECIPFTTHLSPFLWVSSHFVCLSPPSALPAIIQNTWLCGNCAWPAHHSRTALSTSQTLPAARPLHARFSAVRYHAHTCQTWNRPETGPGKRPRLSGCLAVGRDKPATCHGDKVVFTLQGNQWGWAASKYPAAASGLIFISAVIFASWHCQLQLNAAPALIPSCGCLDWGKVSCQLLAYV